MRIRTTNLENRSSPWTDLIALIKVHPALFSSKNCKQHNTCKPNPVSAFSSRLNVRVLQLQESRLCPSNPSLLNLSLFILFCIITVALFCLLSFVHPFDSLAPRHSERWDFVPVFPVAALSSPNGPLLCTPAV